MNYVETDEHNLMVLIPGHESNHMLLVSEDTGAAGVQAGVEVREDVIQDLSLSLALTLVLPKNLVLLLAHTLVLVPTPTLVLLGNMLLSRVE